MWEYRRAALVGALSLALVLAGLGPASGQDGEPFRNGTGKASAVAVRIAPGVGGLSLSLASGVSVAEHKNELAQSQSAALDLGLVGTVLTAPSNCSGRPLVPPESLPAPSRVDNRGGDAEQVNDAYPIAGTSLAAGHTEARATTTPSATASSQPAIVDLAPLLEIDPVEASASSGVVDGTSREARATVETSITLLGALRLSGLRWEAVHRTGADEFVDGTFDLGTASLLGLPVPLDALGDVSAVINNLLAPLGLSITFPTVERFTEPADLVRVTPLSISLRESPVGNQVIAPALDFTRAQREQLLDSITNAFCELAVGALLADIGLSIITGTGSITIEIGGVEASTSDLIVSNPFGEGTAPPPAAAPPTLPSAPSAPSLPSLSSPPSLANDAAPIVDVGPLRDRCESVHPLRDTSCSKGALLAVGLLGLGATAGVGALDWRHQRRKHATREVAG